MRYFLLVYDKHAGEIREERSFDESEREPALRCRRDLMVQHRLDPNIEVALFGAESRDDLMKTHSRYFKTFAELAHGA